MAWIKNINTILSRDYEEQYNNAYIKRSYPIKDEKGNIIARKERYTQMYWYDDEDRLRKISKKWQQPDKQTMRVRWFRETTPRIEWYSDLGHGIDLYTWIDKYIEKNIGKSFARTYSNFLFRSKYARYRNSILGFFGRNSMREVFNEYFTIDPLYKCLQYGYYIDSEGLIQLIPKKTRPKNNDLKIYLPQDQRRTEYCIDYQRVIQAEKILREYFSEHRVNKFIANAGIWSAYYIDLKSFLGPMDSHIQGEILKKIKLLRINRHRFIFTLNDWFIKSRVIYIDRIIKAGTREWHIEKSKQRRAQKYRHKHKYEIDIEFYDAYLKSKKHGEIPVFGREKIIEYAKQCDAKRWAKRTLLTHSKVNLL